ncbi:MAG: hypothetical protein VB085_00665 [Peptococcaceae bacterium]|nr:hypothetical protein [Peptococcaceae bacterium]
MLEKVETHCCVEKEKIFRRLKVTGDSLAAQRSRQVFPQLLKLAESRVGLCCLYALLPNRWPLGEPELDCCSHLVFCFASLGEGLSGEIGAFFRQKEYLEGFILDHLGNEILFNASDEMNRVISLRLKEFGLKLSKRFSPGETGLDLPFQELILRELKSLGPVPCEINEHYMLKPEKSILYLFGADKDICESDIEHNCDLCPRTKCYFRTK